MTEGIFGLKIAPVIYALGLFCGTWLVLFRQPF